MRKLAFAIVTVAACQAFSITEFIISGKVVGYDKTTITLQQDSKALIKVPRHVVKDVKKMKIGQSIINASVNPTEYVTLNPDFDKPAPKKKKKKK